MMLYDLEVGEKILFFDPDNRVVILRDYNWPRMASDRLYIRLLLNSNLFFINDKPGHYVVIKNRFDGILESLSSEELGATIDRLCHVIYPPQSGEDLLALRLKGFIVNSDKYSCIE